MTEFAIAGVQMSAAVTDNLNVIGRQLALTMKRFPWVQMVVFGELSAFGPRPETAQKLPGPAEEYFRGLARRHNVWLIPGSLYELNDSCIYNTALVISPDGEVVARYRKMFPFLPYESGIEAGGEFCVFDIERVGRFGLSICYDKWFPETTRTLAWMGAEVIIHPTLTNTIDRDIELSIARSSSVINQCYFLDINNAGDLGYGRSAVFGPEGDRIHESGAGAEIIPVRVDFDRVRRSRERGLLGLGQPLKSFRDCKASFPAYSSGVAASTALDALGAVSVPKRPRHANLRRVAD